jgi:hypothetical protein
MWNSFGEQELTVAKLQKEGLVGEPWFPTLKLECGIHLEDERKA